MHDMDRIMNEEFNEEYGFLNENEMGYEGEWEGEWAGEGEWEWEGEGEWEWEGETLNEDTEYELAAELLSVSNEEELDQFLGKLVRKVGSGVSRFAKSGIGRTLIGGLKSVAKVGLPIAGKLAGGFFGGPVGAAIGGKLGGMASKLFEIQGEGMSNEDLEFEMARRYVRLASSATRNAATAAKRGGPPKQIATQAIKKAAARHMPGLLKNRSIVMGGHSAGLSGGGSYGGGGGSYGGSSYASGADASEGQSGTWSRRGNRIILYGA